LPATSGDTASHIVGPEKRDPQSAAPTESRPEDRNSHSPIPVLQGSAIEGSVVESRPVQGQDMLVGFPLRDQPGLPSRQNTIGGRKAPL